MSGVSILLNKYKSQIMHHRSGKPSERVKVIGVTGSYGKTIVVHLIKDMLRASGLKVGYISSVGYSTDGENDMEDLSANFLGVGYIHRLLKLMKKNALDYAVVELTGKNLQKNHYHGLILDSAVITNISLSPKASFNGWEEYANTKFSITTFLKDSSTLVLDAGNEDVVAWLKGRGGAIEKEIYTYWVNPTLALNLDYHQDGLNFDFDGQSIRTNLFGGYNVSNALMALKAVSSYIPFEKAVEALETLRLPKGRMEIVAKHPFKVIIDYSYTPEMMKDSLLHLQKIKGQEGKIICVFGCAGERDPLRRRMGEVAAKYSNIALLAAEDPKGEKVYKINSEIYKYAEVLGGVLLERFTSHDDYMSSDLESLKQKMDFIVSHSDTPFVTFDANHYSSRLDAIDFAIDYAGPDDIIYITGKGHENSLVFNNIEYEWSDSIAVKEILERRGPLRKRYEDD